jgi:hypothetical protein
MTHGTKGIYILMCSYYAYGRGFVMKYVSLILLASLAVNIYLYNQNSKLELMLSTFEQDEVQTKSSAVNRSVPPASSIEPVVESKSIDSKTVAARKAFEANLHEEKAEYAEEDEEFPEESLHMMQIGDIESSWVAGVQEYLEIDLGLSAEEFSQYMEIRVRRQEALDKYFLPKIKKAQEESGNEQVTYFPTPEDSIALGKINEKFANKLKGVLGENNYESFSDFRNRFNSKAVSEGNNPGYIIEF